MDVEVIDVYKIELVDFNDNVYLYKQMHKWCSEEFIYQWFEQRVLSYDEIVAKYKNKLNAGIQNLYIINCDGRNIGFVQIYRYDDVLFNRLENYNNIYEYDIFIGEEDCLSKGIGTEVVKYVNKFIYDKYRADCIVLRPFKRNVMAVKCYLKAGYEIIAEYDGKDTIGNDEEFVVLINIRRG